MFLSLTTYFILYVYVPVYMEYTIYSIDYTLIFIAKIAAVAGAAYMFVFSCLRFSAFESDKNSSDSIVLD